MSFFFHNNREQIISETWPSPESEFEESRAPSGRGMIWFLEETTTNFDSSDKQFFFSF